MQSSYISHGACTAASDREKKKHKRHEDAQAWPRRDASDKSSSLAGGGAITMSTAPARTSDHVLSLSSTRKQKEGNDDLARTQ
jgi:hypothetical protein